MPVFRGRTRLAPTKGTRARLPARASPGDQRQDPGGAGGNEWKGVGQPRPDSRPAAWWCCSPCVVACPGRPMRRAHTHAHRHGRTTVDGSRGVSLRCGRRRSHGRALAWRGSRGVLGWVRAAAEHQAQPSPGPIRHACGPCGIVNARAAVPSWGPCPIVSAAVCRAMGAAPWPGGHGWARRDPRIAHRRLDPAAPAQHPHGPARVAASPARLSRPHVPPAERRCHHGHPQARPWANGRCAVRVVAGVAALAPRTAVPLDRTPPVLPRHRHRHRSECAVHGVTPAVPDMGVSVGGRSGAGSGRMLQRASHGKTGESRGGCERWRWRAREWLAQCCWRPHPHPDPHPSRPPPVLSQ